MLDACKKLIEDSFKQRMISVNKSTNMTLNRLIGLQPTSTIS